LAEVLVGTYTGSDDGPGGGSLRLSAGPGYLGEPALACEATNPSYLALGPTGELLFAVRETDDDSAGLASFRRRQDGDYEAVTTCSTEGTLPCHLSVSPDGRFAVVANYGSGSVACVALDPDGRATLADVVQTPAGGGRSPVASHPHMAVFDELTGEVIVVDLGLGTIFWYRLGESGRLTEHREARVRLPDGSGPRHLVSDAGGRSLYVLSENANTVHLLRREAWSTVPTQADGASYASAIRLSRDRRRLLVANRHEASSTLALFDIVDEQLSLRCTIPAHGVWPRDCLPTPWGSLLVANERSGDVALVGIDGDSLGALEAVRTVGAPTCVLIV
jgi:6-phosphogluconolactonase